MFDWNIIWFTNNTLIVLNLKYSEIEEIFFET